MSAWVLMPYAGKAHHRTVLKALEKIVGHSFAPSYIKEGARVLRSAVFEEGLGMLQSC